MGEAPSMILEKTGFKGEKGQMGLKVRKCFNLFILEKNARKPMGL